MLINRTVISYIPLLMWQLHAPGAAVPASPRTLSVHAHPAHCSGEQYRWDGIMFFSHRAPFSNWALPAETQNCHQGQGGRLTKGSRTNKNLFWILNLWHPYLKETVLCYQVPLKILSIISLPISTQAFLISGPNNSFCFARSLTLSFTEVLVGPRNCLIHHR